MKIAKQGSPLQLRILALLSFALLCLPLQGCWDRTEINDIAVILAMGIDRTGKGQVQVSAQIFIPRQSGSSTSGMNGGSSGSPNNMTMVQSAEGTNIAEAVNLLQRKLSRHVFWGHCEAIVFGKEAASRGIRPYIDFLLRYDQIREHAYVYMSDKPAKNILNLLPPLERSSAEVLREMGNMKLFTKITVLDLAAQIQGNSQAVILSRLSIIPPYSGNSPDSTMPYIRGLGVFNKDRFIKSVEMKKSIGFLLITNQLENIVFSLKTDDESGFVSIQGKRIHTTVTPHIQNGKWKINIQIKMDGEVVLINSNEALIMPERQRKVEKLWMEDMYQLAQSTLKYGQQELRVDIFHFADEFARHYPKQWQKAKASWSTMYPNIETSITVQAKLDRIGKSTNPQGITQEKIKTN